MKLKIDNIILFGGTYIILNIIYYLKSKNYKNYLFTSPKMLRQKINSKGTLKQNLKILDVNYFTEENINKSTKLIKLIKRNSLGIVFGQHGNSTIK